MKRSWPVVALVALGILLIFVSFLPSLQTDRWWVRLWDYPRLQVAALLLVVIVAFWAATPRFTQAAWVFVGACLAALAWQFSFFLAYLPPYPKQVATSDNCPASRQLSLLNANVLLTNHDYAKLIRLADARDPDVILLLETGESWAKAIGPLARRYPYRLAEPVPNTYGMILLSKLPMKGRIRHLLQPGVPSATASITLRDGSLVDLYGVHPEPPLPGEDSGERDAELVMIGREVRDRGRAAIVMGDLNDVAWSRTSRLFKKVAGMNDPRVGRGFYPTFNAKYPLLRWPLDHLFVSPHFSLVSIDLQSDIGSDHFPIYFRLCLSGDASQRKVAPAAHPDTEAEATEEVSEGQAERLEEDAR